VLSLIFLLTIGSLGFFTYHQLQKTIENQMGNNAMDLAVTIASMPDIQYYLAIEDKQGVIQNEIERFREKTRFQYIIVMDMNGIQYSYPYPISLGKKYLSGGEERVLETGESYVSADRNRFISAIRAFAPIEYKGEQVGAVLVGLLNDTVNQEIKPYVQNFYVIIILVLIFGFLLSYLLAYNIKKTTFGLEPKEIALLLGEKDLILQSLKTGLFALNNKYEIIMINELAKEVLGISSAKKIIKLADIDPIYLDQMLYVFEIKEPVYNIEIKTKSGITLLASFIPLYNYKNEHLGVVSTFQDMTEVKQMAEELIGIKLLTDDLRAQNHEFLNKLHIISGLIQLEEYDKAVSYISDLNESRQEILGMLTHNIKDVYISGLLLAKYNKASEGKISFVVDPRSRLQPLPASIPHEKVTSIIGNLLENSIEELMGKKDREIYIRIIEDNQGICLYIKDNGSGIEQNIFEEIYNKGTTTKRGQRGFGLWIVRKYVEELQGEIELKSSQDEGTSWEIFIPYLGGKR
jgi:two-component system CitB family sensor kinase